MNRTFTPTWSMRFLALGFALLGHAATGATTQPEVTVTFSVVAVETALPELTVRRGRETATITAAPFERSNPITYQGPALLEFYGPKKGDPKLPAPILGSVVLPQNARKLTLLAYTAPDQSIRFWVVKEDEADLPPNHARLINFTAEPLTVNYDNTKVITIASLGAENIPADHRRVVLKVAAFRNEQWQIVLNNMVGIPEAASAVIIFLNSESKYFRSNDYEQPNPLQMFVLPPWETSP